MKQNQGNKQKNIQSKPLRKIMVMIIAMIFVFTDCQKNTKEFLLLQLIYISSVATNSGPTFTPAIGVLDTSFNSPKGFIIQPIGLSDDCGRSLAIQSDGKILLGGSCDLDFCIARFNSDGTLDTTFGSSGKVIQDISSFYDAGLSLAIQPDGKILLGGHCSGRFCIARFNSNGTPDTSFGTSGKVIQPIGYSLDSGKSLAIQPDGKILLGGYCFNLSNNNYDFCIARFNSNGTLDTSFGSSGKVMQPIGYSGDYKQYLAIQPDGKILLGGRCSNGFCIARFNSNGTLDTTFGNSGKVILPIAPASYDIGFSLAIQPDGKILLGSSCGGGPTNNDFCIARLNPNGTLDTSFGNGGKVIQDIDSPHDYGNSLAIQPDGKIILGGFCNNDFCIARFNSNGTLDTSFGTNGKVIQPIGYSFDEGYSLAIQPDGKILLGGYCQGVSNFDFCIARFK